MSLEVRKGEVFGLLGPNGAGKSTTISMCTGLLAPDSGRVEVAELGAPSEERVRGRMGLAPQAIALYEDLTARENMVFFGRLYGMDGAALKKRVDELLELVGLADRAKDRVKVYSGGMQRRLNLAAALVNDPDVVLLDEPTAGVDPHSRNAIFELVMGLRARGKCVVYTTHYMEEAQRLCDRVGVMDHGKLLALGTVEELIGAHGGKTVVAVVRAEGEERIATSDPVAELQRFMADGRQTIGVRIERPNLESVFLSLTGRSLRD